MNWSRSLRLDNHNGTFLSTSKFRVVPIFFLILRKGSPVFTGTGMGSSNGVIIIWHKLIQCFDTLGWEQYHSLRHIETQHTRHPIPDRISSLGWEVSPSFLQQRNSSLLSMHLRKRFHLGHSPTLSRSRNVSTLSGICIRQCSPLF